MHVAKVKSPRQKRGNLPGSDFHFLFLVAVCLFYSIPLQAQPAPFEEYQFYLTEPAIEILDIRYEPGCEPADGRLSGEGMVVRLRSYRERARIYLRYLRADGTIAEITKSPCYIDPVVPAL